MATTKKETPTLEEALTKEPEEVKTEEAKTKTPPHARRIDKAIVDQEKRLQDASFDSEGNPRVATKKHPPSSHFPERISLPEYNERLAEKRRKNKTGKSVVSKEAAEANKSAVAEFSANYENQPFARTPSDSGPANYRSTPGADDAPAFSTAEKVAGSGSTKTLFVEEKHE